MKKIKDDIISADFADGKKVYYNGLNAMIFVATLKDQLKKHHIEDHNFISHICFMGKNGVELYIN